MSKHIFDFGEKTEEYSAKQNKKVPVVHAPKYAKTKEKAIEVMKSYPGVTEADFWILMNETKTGKMMYSGLIISHNACLKINDQLEPKMKFKPSCMTCDDKGYNNSLTFTYCNDEQGIYEVGEVSASNCKNAYPYAMALKRCMDRVILKSSKIAFDGIMSDSEADEFSEKKHMENEVELQDSGKGYQDILCTDCGKPIEGTTKTPAWGVAEAAVKAYGRALCVECGKRLKDESGA